MKPLRSGPVGRPTSLLPLALPVLVYGLVLVPYYWRLRSTMPLPDYGDLWRMSVRYSIDGRLDAAEPFLEAEPFAHIPVLHTVLNHIAITQADYTVLWIVGAIAAVGTGWLVGAGMVALLSQADRRPLAVLTAALAGVLAFRFDVQNIVTKSLLLESQVLFLQGVMAIAIAGRYAIARCDRLSTTSGQGAATGRGWAAIPSHERALTALLLAVLVVGDAPTAVLCVAMIGLSVTAGFAARRPLDTTFRILGVIAVAALAIRWMALLALDARSGPGSSGEIQPAIIVLDSLKLIGGGLVNLSAVFVGSQETYDRIHVTLAVVLVPLWAVTVWRSWRRSDPSRSEVGLAVCLTLALSFIAVNVVATSVIRGVGNNHQAGRSVRGTALVAPATLAALYDLLQSRPTLARRAVVLTLAAGLCLLSLRAVAFTNAYDRIGGVVRYRERNASIICEQPPTEEQWRRMWQGFNEANIEAALASEHLDFARRAGCASDGPTGDSVGNEAR